MSNTTESPADKSPDPPAKKVKIEIEGTPPKSPSVHESDINLSTFELKRILQNNSFRKWVCVEGTFKGHEKSAIIILEKKMFPADQDSLKKGFFNEKTDFQSQWRNDIYGNYDCFPIREHNSLKATIIHPATQKHIDKYKTKQIYIVHETAELYEKVTLPYILSSSFSLQWVDNILEHKAEADKIIYEDTDKENGFIMIPDLKWDGERSTLMALALPFKRIRSIRELDGSHLELLKNIRDAGTACISKKFDISPSQLRIHFHYRPSYYHLHVHFSYLMYEAPGKKRNSSSSDLQAA